MSDGIHMRPGVTGEVSRLRVEQIDLGGGRRRAQPRGLFLLLLVFAGVGFLAGWITGVYL